MIWTLWPESYRSWQTPGITPGNCLEHVELCCCITPEILLLTQTVFLPCQTLSPASASVMCTPIVSLKVMGHDDSLRSSTQKEPERACWASPGSLTFVYRYLVVNTPHYIVCTINATNNLQITQTDDSHTILKPNELVRDNQLCEKLINWEQLWHRSCLRVSSLHTWALAGYLWMLHPCLQQRDLPGILLLNCHAQQHQNGHIHCFWTVLRDLWSHTISKYSGRVVTPGHMKGEWPGERKA